MIRIMWQSNSGGGENARFWQSFRLAVLMVGLLWVIELISLGGVDLRGLGVLPGTLEGLLPGVLLAPALHGSAGHLFANSVPLVLLITALLFVYQPVSKRVLVALYLVPGAAVWAFGRPDAYHIGASGVVYGLVVFLLVSGVSRRDLRSMAVAMLAYFLYGGSLLWGVLPGNTGVSWETHLAGAVTGMLLALRYRNVGRVPPKKYDWDDDDEQDDGERDPRFEDSSL